MNAAGPAGLLLLALPGACGRPQEQPPLYRIEGEAPADLDAKLERFHAFFHATFAGLGPLTPTTALTVRIVPTRGDLATAFAARHPDRRPPLAFYSQADDTLFLAAEAWDDALLYHEACHQLLTRAAGLRAEPATEGFWLHEALPCLCEGLTLRAGRLELTPPAERLANLHYRAARRQAVRTPQALHRLRSTEFDLEAYDETAALAWYLWTAAEGSYRQLLLDAVARAK